MSHLPNNPTLPIKHENDSDQDDVVFLETVPTFEHRPEEYDPECKCRMCLIVRKLLAKCTCEDCRATGQHSLDKHVNQVQVGQVTVQATENVTHDNEVSPTNALSPPSSININASTSEHANLTNEQDDQSRSCSTPDNQPRFFDNESKSGNLSLDDDDEVDDGEKDHTGLDQKIDRDADENSSDPDYDSLTEQIPIKWPKKKIHSKRSNSKSIKNSKTISQSKKEHKCPHCYKRFSTKNHLSRHHRTIHLQLKPYFYCKWHKCDIVTGRRDNMFQHIVDIHFNKRNVNNETVNHYIGKGGKKVQPTGESITLDDEVQTSIEVSTELLNEVSTSGYFISENDNDDQSRSSTPDYHPPRFFDDDDDDESESGDSNDDDQVEGRDEDEFELDQESDDDDDDGDEDYKASEEDSDSDDDDSSEIDNSDYNRDDNSSDSDYVLSKSLKRSHTKSRSSQTSKHTKSTKSKHRNDLEQTEGRRKRKRFKPKTCPKCKRVLYSGHLKNHLRTHKKWGISCKWPKCGFFYPSLKEAKQHLCADHLQISSSTVELTNAQVCQYLVRLNPKTGETRRIKRLQEGDHNLAGHPQPSKDPNTRQMHTFDCPKCEASFAERGRLLRHYRGSHQKWKPFYCKWPECSFKHSIHDRVLRHADIQHFNKANRAKARTYVGERATTSPSKKGPVYEQLLRDTSFNQNCTTCGRNFRMPSHYAQHLATHKKSGFRCTWQQRCGFFYGSYIYAKQHILEDHLKGELVNEHQINKNLVKVEKPKKGRTNKKKKTNRLTALDRDEDENSSSDEARGSKSKKKKHKKAN